MTVLCNLQTNTSQLATRETKFTLRLSQWVIPYPFSDGCRRVLWLCFVVKYYRWEILNDCAGEHRIDQVRNGSAGKRFDTGLGFMGWRCQKAAYLIFGLILKPVTSPYLSVCHVVCLCLPICRPLCSIFVFLSVSPWARYRNPPPHPPPGEFWRQRFLDSSVCVFQYLLLCKMNYSAIRDYLRWYTAA